jgi:transcriptional regulator with XRE-family HTH domain
MAFVCSLCDDYRDAVCDNATVDRNYLKQWREKKELSQEELAEKVGTTKSVISLLENEKRPLSAKWLRKLADALGTTPGRILDIDPDETSAEMLNAWDELNKRDRPRAIRVLRSLTGTDN